LNARVLESPTLPVPVLMQAKLSEAQTLAELFCNNFILLHGERTQSQISLV